MKNGSIIRELVIVNDNVRERTIRVPRLQQNIEDGVEIQLWGKMGILFLFFIFFDFCKMVLLLVLQNFQNTTLIWLVNALVLS